MLGERLAKVKHIFKKGRSIQTNAQRLLPCLLGLLPYPFLSLVPAYHGRRMKLREGVFC